MLTEAMVERGAAAMCEYHAAFLHIDAREFGKLDVQTQDYYRRLARVCLEAALTNEEGVFEA